MTCDEAQKKLYDLIFDLLDAEEHRAVEAHIATCEACRAAHETAVRHRALLKRWVVPGPPQGLADTAIATAMEKKEGHAMSYKPVEPELRWLGGKLFWKVAATLLLVVVAGLLFQWQRVARMHATPQEAFVYGQSDLVPGLASAFRVFVRDGAQGTPVPNARVRARLVNKQGSVVWTGNATTDERGFANVQPEVADDLPEGSYTLKIDTESTVGESAVARAVAVKRSFRVMVSTDKPLYQPGQTIHIRSLALASADMRPVGGRDVVLEVQDGKGNKVFKKRAKTSDFGIASADFALADQVNTGSYTIAAILGDTTSERTVKVERYRLPKFKIELTTDKGYYQPGEKLTGDLAAVYTFGEPVRGGTVRVVASEFIETFRPFATAEGKTDAEGKFHFEIPLTESFVGTARKKGDTFVSLEATVTDTADHTQKKTLDRTVTTQPIRIELFPESGKLVQGVENILYVVTAYPDGRPAKTKLTIGAGNKAVETSPLGIATVKITPTGERMQLTVVAEDDKGLKVTAVRRLRIGARTESVLLRTDKAVYRTGQTANLTVLSADRVGRVFLDVVKERRAALIKAIDITDGRGQLALDLPPDLFGTLELHAYRIMADGNIVGDTRVIQVARADDLKIAATLDKDTYRPAEKALLKLVVTRENGDPTQAALSLAGVDEAVFALAEMRPGLERIYFALQEEILKPGYEIHARAPITPAQAIQPPPQPEPEYEEATVVLFSAAEGASPTKREASETFAAKRDRIEQEKRQGAANVKDAFALLPSVLFVLLALPALLYAGLKLVRRPQVADLAEKDRKRFLGAMTSVSCWWVLAFYLPVVAGLVGALTGQWLDIFRHEGMLALVVGGGTGLVMLAMLIYSVRRVRRSDTAGALPLLRRALITLPLAYVLAWGSVFALIAAAESWRGGFLEDDVAVLLILAIGVIAACVTGALAIARQSGVGRISIGRWFWLGISRPAFALLPAVFASMLLPTLCRASRGGGGMMPQAMMREMVDEAAGTVFGIEARSKAERTTGMPTPDEVPSDAAGGLKAPTRVRRYFPETLLWRPELITDDKGHAQLEIPLADSITTWRLAMSAVSARGELGAATQGLRVFQDFFVDIDFPVALTQHDLVSVPVAVYNYLDTPQTVRLDVQPAAWFALKDSPSKTVELGPKQVTSVSFELEAKTPGRHKLLVKAHGSEMADAVERVVRVEPDGKAFVETINGRLSENLSREITIPAEAIDGASDLIVKIYPGSFSQVVEGLDSIFRMPYGCFEQTSSTTYPNVLVLDYMRRTKQIKPELEMKALNFINLGYQRLVSYEVKGGGFSWFGNAPAHSVLTAYGLMEFADMAKVCDIDPAILERTRTWLFGQQQGDGSWKPTEGGIAEGAINAFQGATLRTTAYIAWAVAEAGADPSKLGKALDYIAANASKADDAYALALCANALAAGKRPEANGLMDRLLKMKQEEDKLVHWTSAAQGVTHSRGNVLDIETTAIAAHAFLKARRHTDTAHKALAWLVENKDAHGTWHSTQATVHAMRALLGGTGASGGVEGDVNVTISANGKLAKELKITPDTSDVFRLISLREMVRTGRNTIALETSGKGDLAYQIVATHYLPWPKEERPARKEMSIDVAYDTTTLKKNDLLTCRVTVQYNHPGTAQMTIVDLGIPPGFQILPEAFDTLKTKGVIERYSMTGRQVILYFSQIPGRKPITFTYQLRAKFPVKVKTPQSTVYQYYEPTLRDTAKPVELNVL